MAEPAYLARGAARSISTRSAVAGRAGEALSARLLGVADDREQALGLSAVRPHGADQHAHPAGHGRRRRARQGHDRALAHVGRRQRPLLYLDPYRGAQLAVAEAARNVACAGARPLGATNCLNFGNPERPAIMWQFAQAVEGIGAACRALDIPITGGNVSLYNETDGQAIYPTPVHRRRRAARARRSRARRAVSSGPATSSSCSATAAASSAAAST